MTLSFVYWAVVWMTPKKGDIDLLIQTDQNLEHRADDECSLTSKLQLK